MPAGDIRAAARDDRRRASGWSRPCLQGVYQSHQATAAACQVNNINLLRGMIGQPGLRRPADERPADGAEHPRDRRRRRPAGDSATGRTRSTSRELAELWNVDPLTIPHWAPPTHAMQIFRYAEEGSIRFLWIIGHEPGRVDAGAARGSARSSARSELFVVVQDAFLTETPSSPTSCCRRRSGARRPGTFTNADRTVHLSDKAVDPPGEARPDLEIFLDYAGRMDFRDQDGAPLVKWTTPEEAFEAWKECTARPALRLHRDDLRPAARRQRRSSGRATTSTPTAPSGCTPTALPHDRRGVRGLRPRPRSPGRPDEQEYRATATRRAGDPQGGRVRAAARASRPTSYPLLLTTGRTVYHFHTRTKTGRARGARRRRAGRRGSRSRRRTRPRSAVGEGDVVRVESPRRRGRGARPASRASGPVSCSYPFHYGDWDRPHEPARRAPPTS